MSAPDNKGAGFKARVMQPFPGVADGERMTRMFRVGEEITGDLAMIAVREGWAKSLGPAPENKAVAPEKQAGPTGQVKQSSSQPAGQANDKKTSKRRAAKRSSSS